MKVEKQIPIVINILEFAPISTTDGQAGKDTLTAKYCHQNCYADILRNSALAAKEISDTMIETPR